MAVGEGCSNERRAKFTVLRPGQYLQSGSSILFASSRVALVILNSPFDDLEYFKRLYDHASYRLYVDGGANRVFDLLRKHYPSSDLSTALQHALPTAIHGDLDSLKDEVRQEYEDLGVPITRDPDQYSTDFGKAVNKVTRELPEVKEILILGSLGGRVDHGIGLLHEIYREQRSRHSNLRFWLFTASSVSVLLHSGTTSIHTPLHDGLLRRNVGILPLYGKAVISTQGLEWDVQDWPTEMGGQVSTSNHIVADEISITTDVDILFTVEREVLAKKPLRHEETF